MVKGKLASAWSRVITAREVRTPGISHLPHGWPSVHWSSTLKLKKNTDLKS